MITDIENIGSIKHNNDHKKRDFNDRDINIISKELYENINNLKCDNDIMRFQKHIQRTYKITLSKSNLIYFYNYLNINNLAFKKLITKKNLNLIQVLLLLLY